MTFPEIESVSCPWCRGGGRALFRHSNAACEDCDGRGKIDVCEECGEKESACACPCEDCGMERHECECVEDGEE